MSKETTIKHTVSGISVFQTDDYSQFKMIAGNRGINTNKVSRIIKQIEAGNDMLRYYPIQVRVNGQKMEILDGQHRFFICKKLKRPVHYIIVTDQKSMVDIAKVNSNVETWKPVDYLNLYINQGNEHYVKLQKFVKDYGMKIGLAVKLLHGGSVNSKGSFGKSNEIFQNGIFEVLKQAEANKLIKACQLFKVFPKWNSEAFVQAIEKVIAADLISVQDLAAAVNKRPEMLTEQANYKQYIFNLEQIANVGKQKRIVIS